MNAEPHRPLFSESGELRKRLVRRDDKHFDGVSCFAPWCLPVQSFLSFTPSKAAASAWKGMRSSSASWSFFFHSTALSKQVSACGLSPSCQCGHGLEEEVIAVVSAVAGGQAPVQSGDGLGVSACPILGDAQRIEVRGPVRCQLDGAPRQGQCALRVATGSGCIGQFPCVLVAAASQSASNAGLVRLELQRAASSSAITGS